MISSFKTHLDFYGNQIPISISISVTKGLFTVATTANLLPIKQDLLVKLPVILRSQKIATSRLKFRISAKFPPATSSNLDLKELELPILLQIYRLCKGLDQTPILPHGSLSLEGHVASGPCKNQNFQCIAGSKSVNCDASFTPSSPQSQKQQEKALACPMTIFALLQVKYHIPILYLSPDYSISKIFANRLVAITRAQVDSKVFCFDFTNNSLSAQKIFKFLKSTDLKSALVIILGLENLSSSGMAELSSLFTIAPTSFVLISKPCRCGRFLSNQDRCFCHSLVRTRVMDSLPGEVLSRVNFAIHLKPSTNGEDRIRSDFLFNSVSDSIQELTQFLGSKDLSQQVEVSDDLHNYFYTLQAEHSLSDEFIRQLRLLSLQSAFLKGNSKALFADLLDVFSLQSNYFAYAQPSGFIHHRPFL